MYMAKRLKKRRNRRSRLLSFLAVVLSLSVAFGVTYYKMQPVIMRYAVSVAETIMLNSANQAIVNVLEENSVSYDDIVSLSTNDDGYVTSLEIDIYSVNNLKSRISSKTSDIVEQREFYDVKVPLGSFFDNVYTNGLGPRIGFNMQLTTTAFVDFSHEFKSAGINQVLHIIMINIKINGHFVIAGYNKSITVSTSAIAAQTVIVGKSPDAFTNVIESATDNTGGLINDYGALVE